MGVVLRVGDFEANEVAVAGRAAEPRAREDGVVESRHLVEAPHSKEGTEGAKEDRQLKGDWNVGRNTEDRLTAGDELVATRQEGIEGSALQTEGQLDPVCVELQDQASHTAGESSQKDNPGKDRGLYAHGFV